MLSPKQEPKGKQAAAHIIAEQFSDGRSAKRAEQEHSSVQNSHRHRASRQLEITDVVFQDMPVFLKIFLYVVKQINEIRVDSHKKQVQSP